MNRVGDKYVFMWHWAEFKLIISISFLQVRCPHYKKKAYYFHITIHKKKCDRGKKKKKGKVVVNLVNQMLHRFMDTLLGFLPKPCNMKEGTQSLKFHYFHGKYISYIPQSSLTFGFFSSTNIRSSRLDCQREFT